MRQHIIIHMKNYLMVEQLEFQMKNLKLLKFYLIQNEMPGVHEMLYNCINVSKYFLIILLLKFLGMSNGS